MALAPGVDEQAAERRNDLAQLTIKTNAAREAARLKFAQSAQTAAAERRWEAEQLA